jgi:catechol 2,3-dioxygenase-like lactoylglutathione lyase family enzyme
MPEIKGILETSLYVNDLKVSETFYQKVLGLKTIAAEKGRTVAMQISFTQILLLFKKKASVDYAVPHDGDGQLHLAFIIDDDKFESWEKYLLDKEIKIEHRKLTESGGRSLYFRDPDGHLIELATAAVWK